MISSLLLCAQVIILSSFDLLLSLVIYNSVRNDILNCLCKSINWSWDLGCATLKRIF
jgi:hypothetical protein